MNTQEGIYLCGKCLTSIFMSLLILKKGGKNIALLTPGNHTRLQFAELACIFVTNVLRKTPLVLVCCQIVRYVWGFYKKGFIMWQW